MEPNQNPVSDGRGYLPFTWKNRKVQVENQMVLAIPVEKRQKIRAVI